MRTSPLAVEIEKYSRAHSSPLTGFYDAVRQHPEFRYGPDARQFLAESGYVFDQAQFTIFAKAFADAAKPNTFRSIIESRRNS